jgi:flagellar motor switch protein FliN/FliY
MAEEKVVESSASEAAVVGQGAAPAGPVAAGPSVKAARFSEISAAPPDRGGTAIDRVLDVTVQVSVELGRVQLQIQEVVSLGVGSVLELTKKAGDPVDLVLNGKVLAQGEVVVVDESFGIRITKIEDPEVRMQSLG